MTIETKFDIDDHLWTIAEDRVVEVKICGMKIEFIVNPYTHPKIIKTLIKYNVKSIDSLNPTYYEKLEEDLYKTKKELIKSL